MRTTISLDERLMAQLKRKATEQALAIEHGCELVSTDSDFDRFPGLRWRHPLAAT